MVLGRRDTWPHMGVQNPCFPLLWKDLSVWFLDRVRSAQFSQLRGCTLEATVLAMCPGLHVCSWQPPLPLPASADSLVSQQEPPYLLRMYPGNSTSPACHRMAQPSHKPGPQPIKTHPSGNTTPFPKPRDTRTHCKHWISLRACHVPSRDQGDRF